MEKTDNELIAEFMGDQFLKSKNWHESRYKEMPFSTSWDWLMPVWIKAQKWYTEEFGLLTSQFEITSMCIAINATHRDAFKFAWLIFGELKIGDVYFVLLEFIKWYRSQLEGNTVNMK